MTRKPYYVLLTGSKNNAGDFLIKHRAIQLLSAHRADRDIVDVDAWLQRDDALLETFNNAQAIILTGGPALRDKMYPGIYTVLGNLDDIKVPIVTMAIGWRAFPGDWLQTQTYGFTKESMKLLKRIEASGLQSSVRDYHTLNVLLHHGFRNFNMTGCAALFDMATIGQPYAAKSSINHVAFSLGIAFEKNPPHEKKFKQIIKGLHEKYRTKRFDVTFHHSLNEEQFLKVYPKKKAFYKKHVQFANWLKEEGINLVDISGSAENMIDYYSQVDLHVGYRVHAHIYMCSVNRLSILISEDGRGKALRDVLNGLVLDSEYLQHDPKTSQIVKSLTKLKVLKRESLNEMIAEDLLYNLAYEEATDFNRVKRSRTMIDSLYQQMQVFIKQLP